MLRDAGDYKNLRVMRLWKGYLHLYPDDEFVYTSSYLMLAAHE